MKVYNVNTQELIAEVTEKEIIKKLHKDYDESSFDVDGDLCLEDYFEEIAFSQSLKLYRKGIK